MNLKEIYQEVLLAHNERPNNFKPLEEPSYQAYGNNPLCGDELTIYIQTEVDLVKEVAFTGQGCAICKASASLMTVRLQGQSIASAEKDAEQFIRLLSDNTLPLPEGLGELEAILGVRKFSARIKCATLAWHTFLKALHSNPYGCDKGRDCNDGHCC